jgi:hypothetical protein
VDGLRQLYELDLDAVEDWTAIVYEACKPEIRRRRLNHAQAAEFVAAVSDQVMERMRREDPAQYAKFKRALTRPPRR